MKKNKSDPESNFGSKPMQKKPKLSKPGNKLGKNIMRMNLLQVNAQLSYVSKLIDKLVDDFNHLENTRDFIERKIND